MLCFFCRRDVPSHDPKAKAVLCSHCVSRLAGAPELPSPVQRLSYEERKAKKEAKAEKKKAKLEAMKTKTRGKGKGWHLKRVFHYEGQYFSFGKEITPEAAAKLMKAEKKAEKTMKPTKAGTSKPKVKKVRRKRV